MTLRWYGSKFDTVTLQQIRQIPGVTGVITTLYDTAPGEVWSRERIRAMKDEVAAAGLHISGIESVNVHDAIKTGSADRDRYIDNYIETLRNLGEEDIHLVCYNFMPVLDWARTDLENPNPDGTSSLYFDRADFAYFDCCILKREGAEADYSPEIMAQVEQKKAVMTPEDDHKLVDNIIIKTQGFVNGNIKEDDEKPVEIFRNLLGLYKGIDRDALRENMRYFLSAIMPVCEQYGIDMCVHPDDPPLQILGLPRIVTCDADIEWFLNAVDNPHNGLTFCAGSLSAGAHNDVPALARKYASRTKFVHLRSTDVFPNGNFKEASHLAGRAGIIDLVRIFQKENPALPMRVDHAPLMLGDEKMGYNAGYSFHGRMLALGQMEGVMAVVDREIAEGKI